MSRVVWRRRLLEPAEPGPCEEPTCRTIPLGLDVPLLVARYELAPSGSTPRAWLVLRVCAPCDLRILELEAHRTAPEP